MTEPTPVAPWPTIPGTNTMVLGPTGTGKTTSLRTLIDAGLEVFAIFTEPHSMAVLADTNPDQFHWHYVSPSKAGWDAMISNANTINKMNYEDLSKLKAGMNKTHYAQFVTVLNQCANFHCQRTGKDFGMVDNLTNKQAFVIDSLSGLSIMAMELVVGAKPTKAQGEWMVAQDNLEKLINNLAFNTQAHFVLTAHIDRQVDEVLGGVKLMVSSLGKALGPKLPRYFSDIPLATKSGDQFTWSTMNASADLKGMNLPISDNLPPSFVPLIDRWKKRRIEAVK